MTASCRTRVLGKACRTEMRTGRAVATVKLPTIMPSIQTTTRMKTKMESKAQATIILLLPAVIWDSTKAMRLRKRTRVPWLELDEQRLLLYKNKQGMTWDDICLRFPDRTPGAVKLRWYALHGKWSMKDTPISAIQIHEAPTVLEVPSKRGIVRLTTLGETPPIPMPTSLVPLLYP
jgi:Myb-like DNA-binding domain